eukprot:14281121-Alexandrium_andersonii.AAC.1
MSSAPPPSDRQLGKVPMRNAVEILSECLKVPRSVLVNLQGASVELGRLLCYGINKPTSLKLHAEDKTFDVFCQWWAG